jgi:hypothetical protein
MTPKEKALVLCFTMHKIEPLTGDNNITFYEAKQCALIAVDEIYNEIDDNYDTLHSSDRKQYWQDVKSEIEKL